jgi:hypothetical protein
MLPLAVEGGEAVHGVYFDVAVVLDAELVELPGEEEEIVAGFVRSGDVEQGK